MRNPNRLRLADHPGYDVAVNIDNTLIFSSFDSPHDIGLGSRLRCFAMGFFSTPSRPTPRDDRSWLERSLQRVKDIHPQALLVVVSVSVVGTLGFGFAYRRYFRRIPNAQFVSANAIAKKRWIKGVVTRYRVPAHACMRTRGVLFALILSVGDADNFRLYHTPGLGWRWPLKFRNIPETVKGLRRPI